jgi:glycosyltransferase 2 family protein
VPDDVASRRRLAGISSIVGIVIAVAGLVFVGRTLVSEWDDTQALLRDASWGWLVVALPTCLAGMTLVGVPWRAIIEALGEHHRLGAVLRWYFPGQLGKYVPGGIWPVVGRGELAVRGGVSRTIAYASVALSLALTYLAAALTALVFLAASVLLGDDAGGAFWALLVLPLGFACLHPAVLTRLVATAERVLSREMVVQVPDYRTTVRLILFHVPAWVLIAVATWFVARAFTPDPPVAQVLFAGVLSWIVGFVVVPVPGGIGVREAAFAAAAVSLSDDVAATVAIVSRLCFITADLIGAGLVVLWRRRPAEDATNPVNGRSTASPSAPRGARP